MNYKDIYTQYMYSYPHKRTYNYTKRLELDKYRYSLRNKDMSVYIHIPFCKSKCGYCNLFSITNIKKDNYNPYIDAIKRHSNQMKKEVDFETAKFTSYVLGGGTPLILSVYELEEIFEFCQREYNFNIENLFSVIESSPAQITDEKLKLLKNYNWKRLSIGVQSFIKEELKIIERENDIKTVYTALDKAVNSDFERLNIDLIYGIPSQTPQSFVYSIKEALKFSPEEIFLYPLYKQANARLYDKFDIDYKMQYETYIFGRDFLLQNGYEQLSMRSFAKKIQPSPDCGFENTLSLGCGGRTYFDNLHFCEKYVSDKKACEDEYSLYINKQDFLEDISFYILDKDEMKRRYAIKNLLYITGLNLNDYKSKFGCDVKEDFKFIDELIKKAYVYEENSRLYLTKLGFSLSDMIGPMFISKKVKKKMKNYD